MQIFVDSKECTVEQVLLDSHTVNINKRYLINITKYVFEKYTAKRINSRLVKSSSVTTG